MKKILVTGSSGLIGSEVVRYFDEKDYQVIGIDNNMRCDFFGPGGDTSWNLAQLNESTNNFKHFDLDIRNRNAVSEIFQAERPDGIVHCAAQPSHDLAASRPFDDFEVNAIGTLHLLEATRQFVSDSPFVFMSTNKVYGDAPNEIPLEEREKRYEYANPEDFQGIAENCRIDQSMHSLFGVSKAAADLLVQEYGRYFSIPTACLRAGCLTGPNHSGVQLHGFLSYLTKVAIRGEQYTIIGYKGKQVRDQLHSFDVARAVELVLEKPRIGEVYNLGGGRDSNASLLECKELVEERIGKEIVTDYSDEARKGDHICYISDTRKFVSHYPDWKVTKTIPSIIDEICEVQLAQENVN